MNNFFNGIEDFMDKVASIYDKVCHPASIYRINFFENLSYKYHFDNCTFLDMSCSTGETCLGLAKKGFKCTGIDFSNGMIEVSNKKLQDTKLSCKFKVMNMKNLSFKPHDFNIIFNNSLIWLNSLEDVEKVISNVSNLITNNELFIIDIPHHENYLKLNKKPYHFKGINLKKECVYKIVRYDSNQGQTLKTCHTYIHLDYINRKQNIYSHDFTIRLHSINELKEILLKYDIRIIELIGDYGFKNNKNIDNSSTVQIVCQKNNPKTL